MSNNSYTHDAYEKIQQHGRLSYISQTTPDSVNTECEVPAPIKYVVPIIFIPGIMGSNLKNDNKEKVWYPKISLSTIRKYSIRDAKERQIALNPEATQVGYDGDIKLNKKMISDITEDLARARGWGSVIPVGYPNVLMYLESQLNQPFKTIKEQKEGEFKGTSEWEKIVSPGNKQTQKLLDKWLSSQVTELLKVEQHESLADYTFPVFACGYNWLQSNRLSADNVADRMNNEIMAQIKKEHPTAKFKKFIVVTHSMGGLVTRALIQNDKVKDKIAGVVHGVMPASGAPAVYQRITVGWDGWKASTGIKNSITAWITKFMFGDTSERLTATLASAPGGLELLPFSNYLNPDNSGNTKAWLTIKANTPNGEITATLPKTNDPYTEIYKRKNTWWAMMNPDFIDPAGLMKKEAEKKKLQDIFDVYRENIDIVNKLHKHIADSYHENSYAHYGSDTNFKSYGQVVWRCKETLNIKSENELIELMNLYGKKKLIQLPNIQPQTKERDETQFEKNETDVIVKDSKTYNLNDNAYKKDGVREIILDEKSGISKTHKATFYLDIKPTSPGDGTVCYQSGQDVKAVNRNLKNTFIINGYEHASSYDNDDVQLNTLYCIAKIFSEMKKD
ncbi:hypothetical protein B9T31_13280 [Acinetobacter sp. ANC 4558]|uniref:lipase family alpha/beta hydrolase n=1 Tax=Acinetobacter sp. ANC 4558 TaxID=1977876 RepID=UPI000A32DA1F|nr:hypothetical protein [Acinetobacter sp. ANC 4558]OTG84125.1 hypothetical protein B9T31_13280 [Acinetobacter sp. ANC 4558]